MLILLNFFCDFLKFYPQSNFFPLKISHPSTVFMNHHLFGIPPQFKVYFAKEKPHMFTRSHIGLSRDKVS